MFEVAQSAIWYALLPIQLILAYRIWKTKFYRVFPLFFIYILEQLVRFAILFYFYRRGLRAEYMRSYAMLQGVEGILQIGIVCELFFDLLGPYETLRQYGTSILRWSSIFFLLLAVLVAGYSVSGDYYHFLGWMFGMERSFEIVQGGMLLIIALAGLILRLRWNAETLGVALGFGLFTSVNLIAFTIRFEMGLSSQPVLSLVSNGAYDCAALIWVWALSRKTELAPTSGLGPPNWDTASWNQAFTELLRR